MPLALSVHNLVSSVGADAGFAAVIGLAILALLYFAHARETANLREEAAMLAQRLQDAEARLDAARRAVPAQPAPNLAPAPAAVVPVAQIPFAPAGLAAPDLASATRFIPVIPALAGAAVGVGALSAASSITASRVAGTAPPAPAPAGHPGTAEEPPQPAEPGAPVPAEPVPVQAAPPPPVLPPARPPAPAPAAVTAFRTAPVTVAGATGPGRVAEEAANGGSAAPVGVIDEPVPAAPPAPQPPPPDPPARSRQAPIVPPDRNVFVSTRTRQGPPIGRRFAVLVGLLLLVGAVAAVVIATSGTGSQNPSRASGAGRAPARPTPAFNPALITVAVLNGTNTNQLAHHVADRLAAVGYKEGSIATASNQTLTATIVGYQPGAANRTAALHIARTLKLPAGSVGPVDQAARTVACPPPSACTANVIVTVGGNLAAAY